MLYSKTDSIIPGLEIIAFPANSRRAFCSSGRRSTNTTVGIFISPVEIGYAFSYLLRRGEEIQK